MSENCKHGADRRGQSERNVITEILLPGGTFYRHCLLCGANLFKMDNNKRSEITIQHVSDGTYSVKLKDDVISLKNRLRVRKEEITEEEAIAFEAPKEPEVIPEAERI